jgi:hypothetical protein
MKQNFISILALVLSAVSVGFILGRESSLLRSQTPTSVPAVVQVSPTPPQAQVFPVVLKTTSTAKAAPIASPGEVVPPKEVLTHPLAKSKSVCHIHGENRVEGCEFCESKPVDLKAVITDQVPQENPNALVRRERKNGAEYITLLRDPGAPCPSHPDTSVRVIGCDWCDAWLIIHGLQRRVRSDGN